MPIPDFILALRSKIGTDPLWLPGVTGVVVRGDEVLLVRRADNGEWTPVTGIVDPGEEPAVAVVREIAEEADVRTTPVRLVLVHTVGPIVYDNGDETTYLDLVFRLRWDAGEPHPADGENTEARWFPLDALPPLSADMQRRLQAGIDNHPEARFAQPAPHDQVRTSAS